MKPNIHTRAELIAALAVLPTEELMKLLDIIDIDDNINAITSTMVADCIQEIATVRQASMWLQDSTPTPPITQRRFR